MEKLKNLETLEKVKEEFILEPKNVNKNIPTNLDEIKNKSKEYYVKKFFKCIFSCTSKPSIVKNKESNIQELNITKESESIEILINKTENLEQNLENIKENVENIKENVEKIKEKKESEAQAQAQAETQAQAQAEAQAEAQSEDNKEINDKLVEIQKAHEKIEELETISL